MIVLGIDTATAGCSAAVLVEGRVAARRVEEMTHGQAETLLPVVQDVLREAHMAFADINLVGVTVGPGGFTGLRVGLAAARGFALALGCPVVGVTTFEAVWGGLSLDEIAGRNVLVAVESRRAEVYVQLLGANGAPLSEPQALLPEEVASLVPAAGVLISGDGAGYLRPVLEGKPGVLFHGGKGLPDPAVVARLAFEKHGKGQSLPPVPLYIRPPDISVAHAKT